MNNQSQAEIEKLIIKGGILSFEEYIYNPITSQWTISTDTEEDGRDYTLNETTGTWEKEKDIYNYTLSTDGSILNIKNETTIKIASVTDLSGQTVTVDKETDFQVTFSEGAKKYTFAFKDEDQYQIWYMPTLQIEDPSTHIWTQTNTTFSDILSYMNSVNSVSHLNMETGWKSVDFARAADANLHFYDAPLIDNKGVTITALHAGMSGSMVTVDHSNAEIEGTSMNQTVVGTWTTKILPGQTVLSVIVTFNSPYNIYAENKHPLVSMKDGIVYTGEQREAMSNFKTDNEEVWVNLQAIEDIKVAIAAQK
jgi:hypothetical protein